MPNTNQAKKMVRKIRTRTQYNKNWKSKIKNHIRTIDQMIDSKRKNDDIENEYKALQKTVDKATKSGVLHENKGQRIKSTNNAKIKSYIGQTSNKKKTTTTK